MPTPRNVLLPGGISGVPTTQDEVTQAIAQVESAIERKEQGIKLQQEADALSKSLTAFTKKAWTAMIPGERYLHNWHIDAIAAHLTSVSVGEIQRLQIWIPPGSMKTLMVSVIWPAWEWTTRPGLRYFTGSYDLALAKDNARKSRNLMESDWYQERWGNVFRFTKIDEGNLQNNKGGSRLSTSPTSRGMGVHGHRIIIDDAVDASDAGTVSTVALEKANTWYSETLATRGIGDFAEVIIQQRLHENDLPVHALKFSEFGPWTVLCLPEIYEARHPFAWRGDPRVEGELLWPKHVDMQSHNLRAAKMGRHKAAGQLQQRPAAREGEIFKRENWSYFPPEFLEAAYQGNVNKLPKFRRIIMSWDTSFKEKNTSDFVAGGVWGVIGGDRYLLRVYHDRMSLSKTKTTMLEARQWALNLWPRAAMNVLIEKKSNGIEIIEQLQKQIPGVVVFNPSDDKTARAEAAEPDFESHKVHVPGEKLENMRDYDPSSTPSWVQEIIEETCAFPLGANDDLVDMVTMALNWIRTKNDGRARLSSPSDQVVSLTGRVMNRLEQRAAVLRR